MYLCCRGKDLDNELADGTQQEVPFVAVIALHRVFGPTGPNILVSFLCRIIVPQRGALPLFDQRIFFTGVTLFRCFNEA